MEDPFGLDGMDLSLLASVAASQETIEEAEEAVRAPGPEEELEAFTAAAELANREGSHQAGAGPVGRKWIFTLFGYGQEQVDALAELVSSGRASHLVMGFETAPTTGLAHIQGYISFNREQHGRGFLARVLGVRCFCELARNVKACIAYCKKTGQFTELGDEPRKGQRRDLEEVAALAAGGDLAAVMERHPKTFVQYPHGITKLVQYHRHKKLCQEFARTGGEREVQVIFCYGGTGAGKTRSVWAACPDGDLWASSVDLTWFDGYIGQKTALLDDFRDSQASFSWLLKVLDRYPLQVPVKGGFVSWSPGTIYMTSDRPPWELYGNVPSSARKQLYRRITEVRRFGEGGQYVVQAIPDLPANGVANDFVIV